MLQTTSSLLSKAAASKLQRAKFSYQQKEKAKQRTADHHMELLPSVIHFTVQEDEASLYPQSFCVQQATTCKHIKNNKIYYIYYYYIFSSSKLVEEPKQSAKRPRYRIWLTS